MDGRLRTCFFAVGLLVASCAQSGGPESSICAAPTDEALDPTSGVHVIRAEEVTFDDPTPTSGPHLSFAGPTGRVFTPIQPAAQVSLLEQGGLVISVNGDQLDLFADLEPLLTDRTLLHPIDGLESPIVVTAWRSRVTCTAVDAEYISWFIEDRTGRPDLVAHDDN